MKSFIQFLQESAPPSKKAEDWVIANKDEFKAKYGDDWESVLYATAWKLFGEAMNTTDGVDTPDVKMGSFLGHPCIDLDEDEYQNCVVGKQPFARWNNYITNEKRCHAIKEIYHKSKSLLVRCEKTGSMSFLKR